MGDNPAYLMTNFNNLGLPVLFSTLSIIVIVVGVWSMSVSYTTPIEYQVIALLFGLACMMYVSYPRNNTSYDYLGKRLELGVTVGVIFTILFVLFGSKTSNLFPSTNVAIAIVSLIWLLPKMMGGNMAMNGGRRFMLRLPKRASRLP
jgi:hypothetical protein